MKIRIRLLIWNGEYMLAKKMLRDIKKHKTQFLSIFLMAFLGVFVFAGVGGESVGLEVNVNNYYNDTNLADGWIYSPNLDMNFIDDVNNLTPTTQSERQLVLDSIADFSNNPEIKLHCLLVLIQINTFHIHLSFVQILISCTQTQKISFFNLT